MDAPTGIDVLQASGLTDWRGLSAGLEAWFEAPSLTAGAGLATRIATLAKDGAAPDIDLRPEGVRVRVGGGGPTDGPAAGPSSADAVLSGEISAAARELGLTADPTALQRVGLVIDTADPTPLMAFWRRVLGYHAVGDGMLVDPSRRDPDLSLRVLDVPRPLRNRMHVDVVRPAEAVAATTAALGREPFGVYGLTLADPDGNEVDLVPGEAFPGPEAADWRAVFSAMAHYPTRAPAAAAEFATVVAGLAKDAGVPLLIDLRPEGVTIDSGKDRWEDGFQPAGTRFAELAVRIQRTARARGLVGSLAPLRFVQLGIDAVDIPAVRAFWTAALGHVPDPREDVTDICDPHRLAPVIIFQNLDPADVERREQRDRVHLELVVPSDTAAARIARAVAAGGRVAAESPDRYTILDPEGNLLDVVVRG